MAILSPAPIALALALLAVPMLARASEGDVFSDAEIGDALLPVAQCAVAEAGGSTQDIVAIVHVLAKRASQAGVRVAEMARRYCRIHRDAAQQPSRVRPHRRWILQLPWAAHAARPASWPGGRWAHMQRLWRRVQFLVVLVAAGELDDPCPAAFHWGSEADGQPRRTRPVSCGATRNSFWSRPGRRI